jgi:hypothetical protein
MLCMSWRGGWIRQVDKAETVKVFWGKVFRGFSQKTIDSTKCGFYIIFVF